MSTFSVHPVEPLSAVMDHVKAPQPMHPVADAVHYIQAQVEHGGD
jgi:hypothetical protein